MKKFLILLAFILTACEATVVKNNIYKVKTYTITCKLPVSGIKKYEVSHTTFNMPSNFRGGLWYFTTVNGLKVRSTFCHVEGY